MKAIVDIDVIIDEKYRDLLVKLYADKHDSRVDNIVYAIENAAQSDTPPVAAYDGGKLIFMPQREIFRIQVVDRRVVVETNEASFESKIALSVLEEQLDDSRFFRISQSEIINLYHVKSFDFSVSGTITVLFDNGKESWVSRRRVKALKDLLNRF